MRFALLKDGNILLFLLNTEKTTVYARYGVGIRRRYTIKSCSRTTLRVPF